MSKSVEPLLVVLEIRITFTRRGINCKMKMTDSPVVSKVLDGNIYVGIPPLQESAIFDSSHPFLVTKSRNATTVSPSKSFVSYLDKID